MTSNETFGQTLSSWLTEDAEHQVPDHLGDILVRTVATRQRPWWSSPERWLPVATTTRFRGRIAAPRALVWLAVLIAVLLAVVGTAIFTGALQTSAPFMGLATNGRIVVADGTSLKSFAADGTDPKVIATLPATAQDLVISHDGTRAAMVVLGGDEHMAIIRLSDGSPVRLAVPTTAIAMGSPPSWSPDDQRLAFLDFDGTREHLLVAQADGSAFTELTLTGIDTAHGLWSPAWSPDGEWIAFISGDRTTEEGTIYLIRPDGRDLHPLETPKVAAGGGVSWSPDLTVQRLLYTGAGSALTVHIYDVQADKDTFVVRSWWPTWSPNGDRISHWGTSVRRTADVLAGTSAAIGAILPWTDGKSCQEHPELKDKSFCGPATFSPDGTRLIAADITGTSILSVLADGNGDPIVIPLDTNVIDLGNTVVWQPIRP